MLITENAPVAQQNSEAVEAAIARASVPGAAAKAATCDLQRQFVAEFLRTAAFKFTFPADLVENERDDLGAEIQIGSAVGHLREACGGYRELRQAELGQ
jgi:hypothetical protein